MIADDEMRQLVELLSRRSVFARLNASTTWAAAIFAIGPLMGLGLLGWAWLWALLVPAMLWMLLVPAMINSLVTKSAFHRIARRAGLPSITINMLWSKAQNYDVVREKTIRHFCRTFDLPWRHEVTKEELKDILIQYIRVTHEVPETLDLREKMSLARRDS